MKKITALILIISVALLQFAGCDFFKKKKSEFKFKPTKVATNALWVETKDDGTTVGGASPLTVEIKRDNNNKIDVLYKENEVAATGDMWRASGWSATLTTSLLLGVDLSDYEITYGVEGQLDGPSAGGLMTVATMASLLGKKIKKDTTMTGTINIDGSIGPVGGIVHKLQGAKDANKKIVAIPAGARYQEDKNTNESIDLVSKGSELGLTVKTVDNIYEAYELLVGKSLPKPEIEDVDEPEMPEAINSKIKAKAEEWYTRYKEKRGNYDTLSGYIRKSYDNYIHESDYLIEDADSHLKQGLFATSYGEAQSADVLLEMFYAQAKAGDASYKKILFGSEAALKAARKESRTIAEGSGRIYSLFNRLKEEKPRNLGASLAISRSYGSLLEGEGLKRAADNYMKTGGDFAQRLTGLMMGASYYSLTSLAVEDAEDSLEIGMDNKGAPSPTQKQIKSMAELLRKAAESNLNVFESIVIKDEAEYWNMNEQRYSELFEEKELYYAFAKALMGMAKTIKEKAGNGISGDYATLGAAIRSYSYSNFLMAKYYSLGASMDSNGTISSIKNEKALIDMLDFNFNRSKENIAIASKSGGNSPFPIINYERAKVLREKTVDKKVEALLNLWDSSLETEIMIMLSNRLKLAPSKKSGGKTLEYKWEKTQK